MATPTRRGGRELRQRGIHRSRSARCPRSADRRPRGNCPPERCSWLLTVGESKVTITAKNLQQAAAERARLMSELSASTPGISPPRPRSSRPARASSRPTTPEGRWAPRRSARPRGSRGRDHDGCGGASAVAGSRAEDDGAGLHGPPRLASDRSARIGFDQCPFPAGLRPRVDTHETQSPWFTKATPRESVSLRQPARLQCARVTGVLRAACPIASSVNVWRV